MPNKRKLGRLATIGYRGPKRIEPFNRIVECILGTQTWYLCRTLIADVRYSRGSRCKDFAGSNIRDFCNDAGLGYLWVPELGNSSRVLPWMPQDSEADQAADMLVRQIVDGQDVVLMCACHRHKDCHRTNVAELIVEYLADIAGRVIPVTHLGEDEQDA